MSPSIPTKTTLRPAFLSAYSAIDRLPGVATIVSYDGVAALPVDRNGTPDFSAFNEVSIAPDADFGTEVDRPHIVSGRGRGPGAVG